jgi:uncharacterized membrane protein YeiB
VILRLSAKWPYRYYFLETLTAYTLFYGFGLGYLRKFGYTMVVSIAAVTFSLKVLWDQFWESAFLQHFRECIGRFLSVSFLAN